MTGSLCCTRAERSLVWRVPVYRLRLKPLALGCAELHTEKPDHRSMRPPLGGLRANRAGQYGPAYATPMRGVASTMSVRSALSNQSPDGRSALRPLRSPSTVRARVSLAGPETAPAERTRTAEGKPSLTSSAQSSSSMISWPMMSPGCGTGASRRGGRDNGAPPFRPTYQLSRRLRPDSYKRGAT